MSNQLNNRLNVYQSINYFHNVNVLFCKLDCKFSFIFCHLKNVYAEKYVFVSKYNLVTYLQRVIFSTIIY